MKGVNEVERCFPYTLNSMWKGPGVEGTLDIQGTGRNRRGP